MASKKPKGVKSPYICFVQTCREEYEKKHPKEKIDFAEFSKRCGEQWKELPEAKKLKFKEISEKDKKRHAKEMENYVPVAPKAPKPKAKENDKDGGKKRKAKQDKDPNAPKRGLSAYFLFMKDERPNFVKNNPNTAPTQIAQGLGQAWKDSPADVRAKYEAMAKTEKAKYEKAKAEYDKKTQNGHGAHSSTGAKRSKTVVQQEDPEEESDEDVEEEEDLEEEDSE